MKGALTYIGSILGAIASLFVIVNSISALRKRSPERDDSPNNAADLAAPDRNASGIVFAIKSPTIPWPYLFRQEVVPIVGIGILLNYLGLAISTQLNSILYLDMAGTALGAFLLGPWWGAIIGLLANVINWLLFPGQDGATNIFPWLMVNIAGGIIWGFLAKSTKFRRYATSSENSAASHISFLLKFGIVAAFGMAFVGTFVEAALTQRDLGTLALNQDIADAIKSLLAGLRSALQPPLARLLGPSIGADVAWGIPTCLQSWLLYIPDKTISAAMALGIMRFGLPLFQRELVTGGTTRTLPRDTWVSPAFAGLVFAPCFIVLLAGAVYHPGQYWPFWACPWIVFAVAVVVLLLRGPSGREVEAARVRRAEVYERAMKGLRQGIQLRLPSGLSFAPLLAGIVFVLWLPVLGIPVAKQYRAVLNFFCVMYGALFGLRIILTMVKQNIGSARIGMGARSPRDRGNPSGGGGSIIELRK